MLGDKIVIHEIRNKNIRVFEQLFLDYFDPLVRFAESFLFDQQQCEDLVQDLFVYIWENSDKININTSLKSYFYQAVRNRCLNYLKHIKVRDRNHLMLTDAILTSDDPDTFDGELLNQVYNSIDQLPKQTQKIFTMKYLELKKRDEIASELGISENTVKTTLQRGRQSLKESLKDKMGLILFL